MKIKILSLITAISVILLSVSCDGAAGSPLKSEVTVNKTQLNLIAGETFTLTATSSINNEISWFSTIDAVATVSEDGVVTAKSAGNTTITATDGVSVADCIVTVTEAIEGYALTFNDDFDGDSLDLTKWGYNVGTQDVYGNSYGPAYWGNNELQYYTEGDNVKVSDGILKIIAKKESMGDREYTSSRILTRNKFSQTYGYFEAKMKLPAGSGTWPAFWLMPEPNSKDSYANEYGTWASNGEIDIMEMKGRLPNYIDTTIHYGGYWPNDEINGKTNVISTPATEWHTYALEWTEESIAWIIDGEKVYEVSNKVYYSTASDSPSAPFDKPFYIILNLAIGGNYDPQGTAEFLAKNDFTEAFMEVDYVRVYEKIEH